MKRTPPASNDPDQDLIHELRTLANLGHHKASEMRKRADALEQAIENGDVKAVMGAWALARLLLDQYPVNWW